MGAEEMTASGYAIAMTDIFKAYFNPPQIVGLYK